MKTIERIFDAETGETTDIERDMTAKEIADYESAIERTEAAQQAELQRQAAVAKLAALGLSIDDLKALGLG